MYYQHCSAAVQKLVFREVCVCHIERGRGMVYEALVSYITTYIGKSVVKQQRATTSRR